MKVRPYWTSRSTHQQDRAYYKTLLSFFVKGRWFAHIPKRAETGATTDSGAANPARPKRAVRGVSLYHFLKSGIMQEQMRSLKPSGIILTRRRRFVSENMCEAFANGACDQTKDFCKGKGRMVCQFRSVNCRWNGTLF